MRPLKSLKCWTSYLLRRKRHRCHFATNSSTLRTWVPSFKFSVSMLWLHYPWSSSALHRLFRKWRSQGSSIHEIHEWWWELWLRQSWCRCSLWILCKPPGETLRYLDIVGWVSFLLRDCASGVYVGVDALRAEAEAGVLDADNPPDGSTQPPKQIVSVLQPYDWPPALRGREAHHQPHSHSGLWKQR